MKQTLKTTAIILVLLAVSVAVALAAGEFEQAELTPSGGVYEINRDQGGSLYISDSHAGEIWRLAPGGGSYDKYIVTTAGVVDARADSSGRIWFTDEVDVFGYVDPASSTQTTWQISTASNLWGTTFDDSEDVWMSESFGSESYLFRFTPSTRQLCQYDLPGGSASYYLLHDNGDLWLANDSNNSIVRYDIATQQATHWMLNESSSPKGIDLDGDGNFWWADSSLGKLARLDPDTGVMRQYTPPLGTRPWSLDARSGFVWYVENLSDTVGNLTPDLASYSETSLESGTISAEESCSTLPTGNSTSITSESGSLAWSGGDAALAVDQDGWKIYQLPDESPYPAPQDLSTSSGAVYITDQGRQLLLRLPEEYQTRLYLPYIIKK